MKKLTLVMMLLLSFAAFAVGQESGEGEAKKEEKKADAAEEKADKAEGKAEAKIVETESGLKYEEVVVGEGKAAEKGDKVVTHYTLWFATGEESMEKGEKVQSSKDAGRTFPFTVGMQGLIPGWNEGMLGMKPGGTRRLYVPSELGYGEQGHPAGIPANQDLIFEIELVKYGE